MTVTDLYALADPLIEQKIGEKIRHLRLRQNITQARLATDCQLSLSTIKKVEKGEIGSFDTFIRILRILGSLEILFPLVREEQMSPNEYLEFVNSRKKKERQRATTKPNPRPQSTNQISEW